MLLTWLLSVFLGVAQACVTQTTLPHQHEGAHCTEAATAEENDAVDATDGSTEAAKAACFKLCAQATEPTPKSEPAEFQTQVPQPMDTLMVAFEWPVELASVAMPASAEPKGTAPPFPQATVPIAYLRLVL